MFRNSINNLIRSDRPESPTDFVFIVLALILAALWIYATQKQVQIPHFDAVVAFLVLCKGVKIAGNWQKSKFPQSSVPAETPQ